MIIRSIEKNMKTTTLVQKEKKDIESNKNKPLPQDLFLKNNLGYNVTYSQGKSNNKKLSRYTSTTAQQFLKSTHSEFSEKSLLESISHIVEYCNLKNTNISSLPNLKEVGLNLTLDSSSKLQDLSGLKKVGGFINVVAQSTDDMNNYLKKVGIISAEGNILPKIGKGIKLFMK